MKNLRIAVIGNPTFPSVLYSDYWNGVANAVERLVKQQNPDNVTIVSTLVDSGVSSVAYYYAKQKGYAVEGIAPACVNFKNKKGFTYKLFPMSDWGDKAKIVGQKFGDEMKEIVDSCDVLVRVSDRTALWNYVQYAKDNNKKVVDIIINS